MKAYGLRALFVCIAFAFTSACHGDTRKLPTANIDRMLEIMGNLGAVTKKTIGSEPDYGEQDIIIETQRATVEISLAAKDGSLRSIYREFRRASLEAYKWTDVQASAKGVDFRKKLLNESEVEQPDYIYKESLNDGEMLWVVSWTRRIRGYRVLNDFISVRFDEQEELYGFNRVWDVSEDVPTPLAFIEKERAVELAKEYGAKLISTNTQRFRGFLLGEVELVDKVLLTPNPSFDEIGLMNFRSDPNNLRPSWMVIFKNVADPSYKGESRAKPESKMMIWVDVENGEYLGANF